MMFDCKTEGRLQPLSASGPARGTCESTRGDYSPAVPPSPADANTLALKR